MHFKFCLTHIGFCVVMCLILSACAVMRNAIAFNGVTETVASPHPAYPWSKSERIAIFDNLADEQGFLQALLVVQNGQLISEFYENGRQPEQAVNIKSISKSILSALVGIALADGALKSIDQPITDFYEDIPSDKREITVRHLLTMSSGFCFQENSAESNRVYQGESWTANALKLPMCDMPGKSFKYATITTHLLADVLTRATGKGLADFAQEKLFEPMGVSLRGYTRSPEGTVMGGSDFRMTPRDMAAFGQLYLQNGLWNGRQLIPETWIQKSWHMHFGPWESRAEHSKIGYGYLWWHKSFSGYQAFLAEGWSGQFIIIIPALDAVIVSTANQITFFTPWWDTHDKRCAKLFKMIKTTIIPELEQRKSPNK